MKLNKLFLVLFLFVNLVAFAQEKGTVTGKTLDSEMNNEALPFANVFIKGTDIGSTTDFDGLYTFYVVPGTYTLVVSFIGYETKEIPNVIVNSGEETQIKDIILGASEGVALDEINVTGTTTRESATALLTQQKNATIIKESIGAETLSKVGASNAAAATSKISGVTKNESSGDVFIRGLGDRYLTTTMNGLPIPSDDVEKKNIDLNLFSTNIIQNVGISKTYNTSSYADQASGNVDIVSKEYRKDGFSIGLGGAINTNVMQNAVFNNFKATPNISDVSVGFYTKPYALIDQITLQNWNTDTRSTPINYNASLIGQKKFQLFGKDASVLLSVSHSSAFEHQIGIFKRYRSYSLNNSFTDVENFKATTNTTSLLNFNYRLNSDHKISYNNLFVIKTADNVYESGRNGEGYVFDQDPQEDGAFVRDQNLKETRMFVNQLLGSHRLGDKNNLEWALGYNFVNAREPNRIRNEVNILNANTVQFAHVGDFQQRKSSQGIEDTEINGLIKDAITLKENEDLESVLKLHIGANFRQKERAFKSLFMGVRAKGFQVNSIDDLNAAFTVNNFGSGVLALREGTPDLYQANLDVYAGYANLDFNLDRFSGNAGVRYEADQIDVLWDVGNYVGRIGSLSNTYNNFLPALNLKYELTENSFLRFAASKTITLPEFKELAPFEYVSPTGRVTGGNPDLQASENYNFDLKWEAFPKANELFSATAFYKVINDPINLILKRGSSGNFSYDNTGDKADVYGLEVETKFDIISAGEDKLDPSLSLNFNATKMWFTQDILDEFQYKNKTSSGIQGASDLIINTGLSFTDNKENELIATLSANYSSDKIFALGAPEDYETRDIDYNNEIIEKGFLTLDAVVSKQINEKFSVRLVGKNLFNPNIEQTQLIDNPITNSTLLETVSSYKKGSTISLSFKYTF